MNNEACQLYSILFAIKILDINNLKLIVKCKVLNY